MKAVTQQLTQHHKQQYMKYLEVQLEKFCAFMLQQKKQNEKTRNSLQSVTNMKMSSQLVERIKMLQFYQKENFRQLSTLQNKYDSNQFQNRLKRLQYEWQIYSNKNRENISKQGNLSHKQKLNICKCQQISHYVKETNKDLLKKLKKLEEQIKNINLSQIFTQVKVQKPDQFSTRTKSRQSQPLLTNYSEIYSVHNSCFPQKLTNTNAQLVTKKELKGIENNIYSMFDRKLKKIEHMWSRLFINKKGFIKQQSLIELIDEQKLNNQIHDFNVCEIQKSQDQSCLKYSSQSISGNDRRLRPINKQSVQKSINSQFITNEQLKKSKMSRKDKQKDRNKNKSKSVSKSKSKQNKSKEKRKSQKFTARSQYKNSQQSIKSKDIRNFDIKQRSRSRSKSQKKSSVFNYKLEKQNQKSKSKSAKSSISPKQRNMKNKKTDKVQKLLSKEYRSNCLRNHR